MFYPEDSGYYISQLAQRKSNVHYMKLRKVSIYELEFCTSSGSICQINDTKHSRHYGSILFSRPGDLKSGSATVAPYECYAIHFTCDEQNFIEKYLNKLPAQIFPKNNFEYEKTFRDLIILLKDIDFQSNSIHLTDTKKELFQCMFSKFLLELYLESLENISSDTSAYAKNIVNAQNFIREHFNEDITITEIAKAAYLSESFTYAQFKKITGQTPHAYLTDLRLQYARSRLILSNDSISEISLNAGFKNTNYLTHIFKKYEGLTPLQYRKKVAKIK